jgi:probable rRNA maturation factor
MILLDPDLESDPAARTRASARSRAGARNGAANRLDQRLPAASTLGRFLGKAKAAARLRGQVTVLLTTDAALRNLNRRFRGKNKPTDVLSFPADVQAPGATHFAGDLAISIPTARRQASQHGHSLSTEVKVLMLHGLLHLAGYDHESDSGQMERRELRLRALLRLPQGLIERAATLAASARRQPKRGHA